MKAFKDYEKTETFKDYPKLPVDAYVCVIKAAEEKTCSNGSDILEISFDIAEGDYKDFYANDYRNNSNIDKKWKGKISLFVPIDDGSEKDDYTKKRFKTAITAIENSNDGYHWDWNEKALKGKKLGILYRNEEWEWNGKTGWKAAPFRIIDIDAVYDGQFKIPADKPLEKSSSVYAPASSSSATFEELTDDEDLPF